MPVYLYRTDESVPNPNGRVPSQPQGRHSHRRGPRLQIAEDAITRSAAGFQPSQQHTEHRPRPKSKRTLPALDRFARLIRREQPVVLGSSTLLAQGSSIRDERIREGNAAGQDSPNRVTSIPLRGIHFSSVEKHGLALPATSRWTSRKTRDFKQPKTYNINHHPRESEEGTYVRGEARPGQARPNRTGCSWSASC